MHAVTHNLDHLVMNEIPPSERCSICTPEIGHCTAEFIHELEKRRYSPRSTDTYRRALEDMAAFLATLGIEKCSEVTAEHLERYQLSLVERGFKPASMDVYLRAVRGLFGMLEQKRRIFVNPAANLRVRDASSPIQHVPTEDDVRRLLEAPDTSTPIGLRDRAVLETAYATAIRRTESARLPLESVDLEARTLRIMGKGERERIVPLTMTASGWLDRYLTDARPKLKGAQSGRLWLGLRRASEPVTISFVFRRHSMAAGLDTRITPHAMRRACATHMLRNGAHPVDIQHLLGHADLGHLSRYLAVSITELRQSHAESRLGR